MLWLAGDERPFALTGEWLGGLTAIGSEPLRVAERDDDPFSLLASMSAFENPVGEARVGGGWIGWLSYGLGARVERLPPPPPAPVPQPAFSLAFYDHVVVYDGAQWWFEALWSRDRDGFLRERFSAWKRRLEGAPARSRRATVVSPFTLAAGGAAAHVAAVADCRERIAAGELFQANLCLRLEARVDGEPLDLFARASAQAKPRFGAFLDGVVSLSPERFLRREGRTVSAEPMKGTRPRPDDPAQQREARDALLASAKDAAEHVMIVDLMRNDLGRVCEYGSIQVTEPRVEPHAGVWQMVSTVSGRLRDDVGDDGLLRAAFPPGSVTGAPKVQAMKVIAALESTRRELYTGAVVLASPIAGLDTSVAIRTFEIDDDRIWFGAGGAVVADSEPESELAEALDKARGPLAAIGGRLDVPERHSPRRTVTAEPALRHGVRPDPAAGVFETVLVERGRAVLLAEHLARLSASVATLYGASLDDRAAGLAQQAAEHMAEFERARLRVLADADGSVEVTAAPEPAGARDPIALVPYVLPGGLGPHKWRDRTLLQGLAGYRPGTVPLLVDADGLVLEAAHANVWIVEHGTPITPPADGRILPGVTRARLLARTAARCEPISLDRLRRAEQVFLTSSISGRRRAVVRR